MSAFEESHILDENGAPFTSLNPLPVDLNTDTDSPIYTHTVGEISTGNSTSTPLGVGATFTGTGEDIKDESVIIVSVFADQASATDGLSVEFSIDNSNWDHVDPFTIPANTGKTFSFQPIARYFRVRYTNGGTIQTVFRLQTSLKSSYVKPSSHRVADDISNQDDAELTKAVLTGEDSSGNFHNVKTTQDGNLTISDNSDGLAITEGNVTGKSKVHKFGSAPDFDTTDGEVDVWDGADDGNENLMSYTFSSSADIDSLSSSSGSDTVDIEVQGLDTDYNLVTQTITLTGQTRVALTTSLIRVFRLKNVGSSDIVGRVYCFVNVSTTGGVPDTLANVRAVIDDGNNQTEMAIYTVPAGKTAYVRKWYASSAGANRSTNIIMRLKVRPFGQVFQLKHKMAWDGSIPYDHDYVEPEGPYSEKSDIKMTSELTAVGVTGGAVSAGFDLVLVDN